MNAHKRIDTEIIVQYMKNPKDMSAFNKIYEHYRNRLYCFSYSYTRNHSGAEEVVQETFIRMIDKIKQLRDPESFQTWLFKTCYSCILLYHRKENRFKNLDDVQEVSNVKYKGKTQVEIFEENEALDEIKEVMEELGTRFQSVAMLYYFDELKIKEISDVLKIPEGTVKTRLRKIKEDLKVKLDEKGISPEKYMSIGLSPLIIEVFREQAFYAQMSSTQVSNVLANITQATVSSSVTAGNVAALFSKQVIASVLVATAITFGTYTAIKSDSDIVDQIVYQNKLTNNIVEVQVLLNKNIEQKDIVVLKGAEEIAVSIEDKKLLFHADENDTYKVIAGDDESYEITINSIDREAPVANLKEYREDGLSLDISDDNSGVDYDSSYVLYNETSYPISPDGSVSGEFDGSLSIYVYDKVGNVSEYTINISE